MAERATQSNAVLGGPHVHNSVDCLALHRPGTLLDVFVGVCGAGGGDFGREEGKACFGK